MDEPLTADEALIAAIGGELFGEDSDGRAMAYLTSDKPVVTVDFGSAVLRRLDALGWQVVPRPPLPTA